MANTNPARGMRDFLPSDVRKREYVIGVIKEVYESYGFEPLETPAVENIETLTGKYGEEGNQLIFKILKRGEKLDANASEKDLSDLALRYDLTVPLARVVANRKNDLPKFFKRYQIQPVWRADRPARGRFREFYQCDVDVIGSNSMLVEAELCAAVSEILERLGFDDFVIRVNNRQVLAGILESAGVEIDKYTDALVALDKIDKIGREGVELEFKKRGISNDSSVKLLTFFEFFIKEASNKVFEEKQKLKLLELPKVIKEQDDFYEKFKRLQVTKDEEQKQFSESDLDFMENWLKKYDEGLDELIENHNLDISKTKLSTDAKDQEKSFLEYFKELPFHENIMILTQILKFVGKSSDGMNGLSKLFDFMKLLRKSAYLSHFHIDPSLARGLSYYTGAIFEINVPDLAGSLGGGGRYDGLIGMFGKEQIPACGFSLGLERILVVMEERGMFPKELSDAPADVMVTVWNAESVGESLKLAAELRKQRLRVLVYPEADKLGKQFKYADSIRIPFVCVLGETELAENKVTLKNLKTGEQETVSRDEVSKGIKKQ